nr:MAG TPA: hypothetical protein [Caudoviricetes sp.]
MGNIKIVPHQPHIAFKKKKGSYRESLPKLQLFKLSHLDCKHTTFVFNNCNF